MKAIFTLLFVLFIGVTVQAQNKTEKLNVLEVVTVELTNKEVKTELSKETKLVRLHKFKTSRVRKALAFKTKRNKSKLV